MTEQFSIEALTARLAEIAGDWHEGTHQGNNGNHGNTLEHLLGISENNLRVPDYGTIEVKAKIAEKGNLFTLFHKEPLPAASLPKLIRCFGWRHSKAGQEGYHPNELSFRSTTGGNIHTPRGFKIELQGNRIVLVYDATKVSRATRDRSKVYTSLGHWADDIETRTPHYRELLPVYWDKDAFIQGCITKLDQTMVCFCKQKIIAGKHYFKYFEAWIYSGFRPEQLDAIFAMQGLFIDIDARTGHNHGIKLRIKPSLLPLLFRKARQIL